MRLLNSLCNCVEQVLDQNPTPGMKKAKTVAGLFPQTLKLYLLGGDRNGYL